MFFNPVLKKLSNVAAYIMFWFLIAVINFIVLAFGFGLELLYAAADSIVFNFILSLLALSFWYPVKYISFGGTVSYKIILSHFIGSILASAVWISVSFFILIIFFNEDPYRQFLINSIGWRFLSGIIFYFFITSVYYVIIYYSELQEKNKKESELQNLLTMAELKSLKFQINPHFIFNSLNSLSALTILDPARARIMTLKISDFLRHSLSNNEKQKSLLSEEINNLRLYLDIEKVRFEERFTFSEDIPEECLKIKVPNMILQPLIENAFKHSVYEAVGTVKINLSCSCSNGDLIINFTNTYEEGITGKKGAGVGLKNITGRLELLYNRKGLLDIKNEHGIFSVKIIIPVEEDIINAG